MARGQIVPAAKVVALFTILLPAIALGRMSMRISGSRSKPASVCYRSNWLTRAFIIWTPASALWPRGKRSTFRVHSTTMAGKCYKRTLAGCCRSPI